MKVECPVCGRKREAYEPLDKQPLYCNGVTSGVDPSPWHPTAKFKEVAGTMGLSGTSPS